jgi:hypothetical protein
VTACAVGRPIDGAGCADRIVLSRDGVVVGGHACRFGKDDTAYDPWDCVLVLARALRNGAPFKDSSAANSVAVVVKDSRPQEALIILSAPLARTRSNPILTIR